MEEAQKAGDAGFKQPAWSLSYKAVVINRFQMSGGGRLERN